jgi:hypothetical protein
MLTVVFVSILLVVIRANLVSSTIEAPPIPFGNERLNDFYFVQNGTIFHQFVCTKLISIVKRFVSYFVESWSLWWYS